MKDEQFNLLITQIKEVENSLENKLLLAISNIGAELETKFDTKLQELETRLETKFDTKLQELETRLETKFDTKLQVMEKKFKKEIRSVKKELTYRIDNMGIHFSGELVFIKDDIREIKKRLNIVEEKIGINNGQNASIIDLMEKRYYKDREEKEKYDKNIKILQSLAQKNDIEHKDYDRILNIKHV